jgi:hypothetical protein
MCPNFEKTPDKFQFVVEQISNALIYAGQTFNKDTKIVEEIQREFLSGREDCVISLLFKTTIIENYLI